MLSKTPTAPVSIAELLNRDNLLLCITFEETTDTLRPWLIQKQKEASHLHPDEITARLKANQRAGANWCKTNRLGWERQLHQAPPFEPVIVTLKLF